MKYVLITSTLFGSILLGSCSQSETEAPTEEPVEEATPSPEEPVSILRPDVEQPEQEPILLEPLRTVIGFPEGGAELDASAKAALEEVLESEQIATGAPIVLSGHSDAGGTDRVNKRVSEQRAEAVRDWLVERGVEEDRIEIIAFGEQNPVQPNALPDGQPNEAGRAANRRVELLIVPPEGTIQENPPTESAQEETSAEASD